MEGRKITVSSYLVEFGYELIAVIPYAYYLKMNGLLKETISGKDTKDLYYFSPKHTEVDGQRHWDNMGLARQVKIPNIDIHKPQLDWSQWIPPSYNVKYDTKINGILGYKPKIIISNKKNNEWGKGVVNHFDRAILENMFAIFSDKYIIIYNSTYDLGNDYDDTVPQIKTDVSSLCKDYGVIKISDLCKMTDYSYNLLQLRLYPFVDKFISIQGGSSIFASYFGGTNIIYAKEGRELEVGSYDNWYNKLGNSEIIHVDTYTKLIEKCIMIF